MAIKHIELIRTLSAPLDPEPTGVEPHLEPLSGIRAVLFDVYGTLFVSGAGATPPAELAAEIARGHERSRAAGERFPEVDIREIWRTALDDPALTEGDIGERALRFECAGNPVWPMPHLGAALGRLREAGLAMGIVSNAQFFTPLLFEALLCAGLEELGFAPELCRWSFSEGCAKPSPVLFARAAGSLAAREIAPDETLFVGNDMLNDISPARATGFRTALFAGCARSLREREGDPRVAGCQPDIIVTDLAQLPGLVLR